MSGDNFDIDALNFDEEALAAAEQKADALREKPAEFEADNDCGDACKI